MKNILLVFAAVISSCLFSATTNYVRTSAVDWSNPESFTLDKTDGDVVADVCPGGDDVVILPENCSYSFVAGTDSFNVFANVKQISFINGGDAVLNVDVPGTKDDNADLNCSIFSFPFDSNTYSDLKLVKSGGGTLNLKGEGRQLRSGGGVDAVCRYPPA
jgi:hypothetical protein